MRVFIFLNSGTSNRSFYRDHYRRARIEGDIVMCADGGYAVARSLNIEPQTVIGDLDSVGETLPAGVRVIRYPSEKDFSDFELALREAERLRPERIVIYGALGGRVDHELINLVILAYSAIPAVFMEEGAEAYNVVGELLLEGKKGWNCSLVSIDGPCRGVQTDGLFYPLRGEVLTPSSRGLSNVVVENTARIRVKRGRLLALLIKP